MFKRKNRPGGVTDTPVESADTPAEMEDVPPLPASRLDAFAAPPALPEPAAEARPEIPHRMPEVAVNTTPSQSSTGFINNSAAPQMPPLRRMPTTPGITPSRSDSAESKRLTVGRDICLNGKITACDVLVVEGTVEAALGDGRLIEIAETGVFKGSAEIDNAEIAGRFEGDITVRGRLLIKATGKVVGSVRFNRLEVELGGEIVGDVNVTKDAGSTVSSPVATTLPNSASNGLPAGLTNGNGKDHGASLPR